MFATLKLSQILSTGRRYSMSTINGRILQGGSKALLWVVSVVVGIIIGMAFVLSYNSQVELAAAARIPPSAAWAWPIIVDGTIIVATFATLILHPRDGRATRTYPWVVLIVFGGLSVYANGIHAVGGQISDLEAFIVGAVPPLALLLATHLLVIMLTGPERGPSDEELVKAARQQAMREARAAAAAQQPRDVPRAAPTPAVKAKAPVARTQVEERVLEHRRTTGQWPSGSTVGAWLGQSSKTGQRLVNKLKDDPAVELALAGDAALV